MTNYQYLIIGGGMTAAAAVDGIREVDSTGTIGLISEEPDAPYNRPPLTKALWKGKPLDIIWRKTETKGAKVHLGRVVKEIAPKQKRVADDKGEIFTYQKLLLATGGRPRLLPFGKDEIIYFRTLADYRHLRALTEAGRRFAVIGGGFIGSEIAAAFALNGKEVVMIFPGKDIGDRLFPRPLAQFVSNFYKQKGIEVLAEEKIVGLETRGSQRVLKTSTNREIVVDGVVAGIGIEPNIELAQAAGLEVDDGIIVDEFLRTRLPDIHAAGDVAVYNSHVLGKRIRVEHEDNANSMGRVTQDKEKMCAVGFEQLQFPQALEGHSLYLRPPAFQGWAVIGLLHVPHHVVPSPFQHLRGFTGQVNPSHCHIEVRLIRGLVFRA